MTIGSDRGAVHPLTAVPVFLRRSQVAGNDYDIEKGAVFSITVTDKETIVDQIDFDLSQLRGVEDCRAFIKANRETWELGGDKSAGDWVHVRHRMGAALFEGSGDCKGGSFAYPDTKRGLSARIACCLTTQTSAPDE